MTDDVDYPYSAKVLDHETMRIYDRGEARSHHLPVYLFVLFENHSFPQLLRRLQEKLELPDLLVGSLKIHFPHLLHI